MSRLLTTLDKLPFRDRKLCTSLMRFSENYSKVLQIKEYEANLLELSMNTKHI